MKIAENIISAEDLKTIGIQQINEVHGYTLLCKYLKDDDAYLCNSFTNRHGYVVFNIDMPEDVYEVLNYIYENMSLNCHAQMLEYKTICFKDISPDKATITIEYKIF